MRGPIFGYMQWELVQEARTEVELRMRAFAAEHRLTLDRVECHLPRPSDMMWSLLQELDRQRGTRVAAEVAELAHRRGVDIHADSHHRAAATFAALVHDLEALGGGTLLIPSPMHLDGMGGAGAQLVERLSRPGSLIDLWHLGLQADLNSDDIPTGSSPEQVCEFSVAALGWAVEVASLNVHVHLGRAGLGNMVALVDAVLTEIVDDAVRFDLRTIPDSANRLTVQLELDGRRLIVRISETREHADEPISQSVHRMCESIGGRVQRGRLASGRTLTQCTLPVTQNPPAELPSTRAQF